MKMQAGTAMPTTTEVPLYLSETYWWAYVHPRAIHVFERQWLVNAILWGQFGRLRDLALDAAVFTRSRATRGSLGGLARATADVVDVLDGAGFDPVLIETVGAGQSEVDIARTADTTIVIELPSAGDEIQAFKAGILEIADVLVVNKADLPGADNAMAALRAMLDLGQAVSYTHLTLPTIYSV